MIELTKEYTDYLHAEALKLLESKGVEAEGYIIDAVKSQQGIHVSGNRLYFDSVLVEEVIQKNYALLQKQGSVKRGQEMIRIGVCDLPQYYMRVEDGQIQEMTVKTLIEATKFLESMKQTTQGVWSMVPGVPRDVPAQLQAITEYYIGCEFCSNGGNVDTMYPVEAVEYIRKMANAMGGELDSIGMFTISPLRLGGFEMEMAIRNIARFSNFSISSLPSPGATAPIFIAGAWIISIAEVLAGAVVLSLLSKGKPVSISAGMFPFEPRKIWTAGGMPEHAIMEYQRSIIAKRYNPDLAYSHSMTTSAKRPSMQAGIEKSLGALFAAEHGCREFNTAGLLSFDDIFSPTQFILDVEIRNMLYPYLNGQKMEKEYERLDMDWSNIIEEGLQTGYTSTDTTLEYYHEAIYFSPLLNRDSLQKQLVSEKAIFGSDMVTLAQKKACQCIKNYQYHADTDKITKVRKIFNEAWEKLSGGMKNPISSHCFL